MKTLNSISFTLVCLLSANSFAADKPMVYDKGLDMDTRYYSVACPDGRTGSVSIRYNITEADVEPPIEEVRITRTGNARPAMPKIVEVCVYSVSGRDKFCRAKMDIQQAAKEACK